MEKILAIRKNSEGDIIAIKTNNTIYDYQTAIEMAKKGQLDHVDVFHKYGKDILRSQPDDTTENNLDNLPQF